LRRLKDKDVWLRVVADFAIVHCAMAIAFAIAVVYQARAARVPAEELLIGFQTYYYSIFAPLSLIFPVVFFLNGIYSHVRSWALRPKFRRFGLAILIALVVFVAANTLLVPGDFLIGRSVALPFAGLCLLGLTGIRAGKEWLVRKEAIAVKPTAEPPAGEDGPVLVIGGAGYIGCWLVRRLLEEGYRVRVMDNAVYGLEPIQDLLDHPALEFLNGDCRNIQDVVRAFKGVSSAVHLAAIVGDPACEVDRKTTVEINYAATRMIVEIARGNGVKRLLFASSCSVYGATSELMDENSRIQPISLYGETKDSSERALMEAASDDFHPIIMRFATVFGLSRRLRFDLVVNLLSAKAWEDGLITIFNGGQWRPFIHVKDIGEAIILLLRAPLDLVGGEIFNVGDNRLNHTLAEVSEVIKEVFPGTVVAEVENSDKRDYRVNFSKIESRTGFHCRFSLEDGVRQMKAAFEAGDVGSYKKTKFSNVVFLRESGAPVNKSDIDAGVMAAFSDQPFVR
jgi:nucleoside-diphosphate-sugar epimerase